MEGVIDLIESSDDEQRTRVGSHGNRWNVKESEAGVILLETGETGLGSSPFHDSHCPHRTQPDVVLLDVKPPLPREQKALIPCENSVEDTDDTLSSDEELLFRPLAPLRQRLLDAMHRKEDPVEKGRGVVNRHQWRQARQTDTIFINSDYESRNYPKKRGKSFESISPFCAVDMDNEEEIHCDSQNTAYGMEDLALDSTSQRGSPLNLSPNQSLTGCSTTSSNDYHPVDTNVVSFPETNAAAVVCSDVIAAGGAVDKNRGDTHIISPLTMNLTREIDSDEDSSSNSDSSALCNLVPLKKKGREAEDRLGWKYQRDEIKKAKQKAKESAKAQARAEKEIAKETKALQKLKEKEAKLLAKIKEQDEKKRKKLEIQAANGKFYDEEIVCIMDRDLALRCPSLLEGTASQDGCTEEFEVRPSKEEEEMVVPHSGAVWWARRSITNQCNETEIAKVVVVVIDDATMFLDSMKDRSSPPNDYPVLEHSVNKILASVNDRFDRVMLFLQGVEEEINKRIASFPVGEKGTITMDDIQDVSAWLIIAKQVDVMITFGPNETAKHLWNLTKALAMDPYRVTQTQISCTKVLSSWSVDGNVDRPILDIWLRQLGQIRGISEPKAQAIVKEYPSWRKLMMALHTSQNPYLLEDILSISGRKERALSRRIYEFMTNCDPDCFI